MDSSRVKPCKVESCDKKRYANQSLCFSHWREKEKAKKEAKAAKAWSRKVNSKKYQKSETKKWHAKCWKLMSEVVRRTGADWKGYNTCITCRTHLPWKELHAGHYQHSKLDFDERNIKPQCAACNTYRGGRLDIYTIRLAERYGMAWVVQLQNDAAKHPGYRLDELKLIYIGLQERLRQCKEKI